MADYPDARQVPPTRDPGVRAAPPYNQTNTTVNAPERGTSLVMPALVALAVVALVGAVAWRVLDDDATVTAAPATQATAPDATPPVAPAGDPAPATPPVGDPPATPPATPPTAAPGN